MSRLRRVCWLAAFSIWLIVLCAILMEPGILSWWPIGVLATVSLALAVLLELWPSKES